MQSSPTQNSISTPVDAHSGGAEINGRLTTEKEWHNLLMKAPVPIAIYKGSNLVISLVNDAYLPLMGKNREEVAGRPVFDVMPECRAVLEPLAQKLFSTGQPFSATELELVVNRHGEAETCYFDLLWEPLRSAAGSITGIMVVAHEVTPQVEARKKLEATEEKIRGFILHAPVAMCLYRGPQYTVEIVNDRMLALWGKTGPEAFGKPVFQVLPEVREQGFEALLQKVYTTGETYSANGKTITLKKPGGEQTIYINLLYEAYREADGTISGVVEVANDITEQVLAQEELKRFKHMADNATEPFILMREDGSFAYLNKIALQRWGYTPEEAAGIKVPDVDPVFNAAVYKATFEQARNQPLPPFETIHQRKDGTQYPVEVNMGVLQLGGKPHLFAVARDITNRKRYEQELKHTKEQLELTLKNVPSAIYHFDKAGNFLYLNDKGALLLGYNRVEDVLAEKDLFQFRKRVEETYEVRDHQGQPLGTENLSAGITLRTGKSAEVLSEHIHRKTGVSLWLLSRSAPLFTETGELYMVISTSTDITPQKTAEQAIRQNEERLSLVIEAAGLGLWDYDMATDTTAISDRTRTFYGLEEGEPFTFSRFLAAVHPDDRNRVEEENRRTLFDAAAPTSYQTEFRTISNNGLRWLRSIGRVLLDKSGKKARFTGAILDITAEKLAAQTLSQSEEKFRSLAETLPQLVWITGAQGEHEYASPQWEEYTGLNPEAPGSWQQTVHPADLETINAAWAQSLATGDRYKTEVRLKGRNGEYRWFLGQGKPIRDGNGAVVKWIGAFMDVHEQKLAGERLKESSDAFRQLANLVPQIIWTARPDGFLDYYNKRWYEYTGFEEGYGDQSWLPILHPDDLQLCIDAWYHSVNTGEPYQIEYRFKDHATGLYRWFLGKALPIHDADGVISKWFGTCTDIHDQKTLTERLEEVVAERTLELQRSNEDLQQFAHVASHDLKEPVRKIKTFSSRLEDEVAHLLPDSGKLYLGKVQSAADRMYMMIDGVLAYSTINVREQALERVNVTEVVRSVETDLEVLIHQKGARLTYGALPEVEGAQVLIYQLFYNLINNALKFSKTDGTPLITVTGTTGLEDKQPVAIITVADNGIGFGQDQAEKIFNTFTRLNSKDKYEGTGLGLSLCKKIVQRHHGGIQAKGVAGAGASFILTLPVKQKGRLK